MPSSKESASHSAPLWPRTEAVPAWSGSQPSQGTAPAALSAGGAAGLMLLPGWRAVQVVAAAGAVNHEDLVKLSEKAFTGLSTDPTTAYDLAQKVRRPAPPALLPAPQACV